MKHLITTLLTTFAISFSTANAAIVQTNSIESILPCVDSETLVLFNITDVLLDSTISLGTHPSREYIKSITEKWENNPDYNVLGALNWHIATRVPQKPLVKKSTKLVQKLQADNVAVAAITARGRSHWHSAKIEGVDDLTEQTLENAGFDFKVSPPPIVSIQMEGAPYLEHYRNGIYYCDGMDKGAFLKDLFESTGYRPSNLVLVDDDINALANAEEAMKALGVPFVGFWYTRALKEHDDFIPMVAVLQLEALIEEHTVLSDKKAEKLAKNEYQSVDPDTYFLSLLDEWFGKIP